MFGFLAWAWWDSGMMATVVSWGRPVGEHAGWLEDGVVDWEYRRYANGFVGDQGLWGGRSAVPRGNDASRPGFAFPVAFGSVYDETVLMECEGWKMAMWVVLVIYTVVWLGAVVWWQRRKARVVGSEKSE